MEKQQAPSRPPRPSQIPPLNEFESCYKEAYKLIDNGITLVTEGKNTEASKVFEQGLFLIDKALNIKIESLDVDAEQCQLYAEMQNKMRMTRKEVMLHFSDSQVHPQASGSAVNPHHTEEAPPSYEDYLNSLQPGDEGGQKSVQYPSLASKDLQTLNLETDTLRSPLATPIVSPQSGEIIFHIENGVQIFFIYTSGRVTSPSYPSFLSIFTVPEPICSNEQTGYEGARGFLQVGEWSYPLVPSRSPVLHSFYGAYMFPDVTNPEPGSNVGIIIPDTVSKDVRELFEHILAQMTSYQVQTVPEGVDADEERAKVAKSSGEWIAEGAEAVSKGVVWGAEKLSGWISYGSDKLRESLMPEERQRPVDPKLQKTAEVARTVSGKAVKVSGFLLSQVGKATMALGRRVAPSIQRHGTNAIVRLTGQTNRSAEDQVSNVMEVASGAVRGASTIYYSLENAAATLAVSLSDNTVKVVTHKYGPDYGALTGNTLYAVGQTAMAGHNLTSLGVKGIAKRTAKDTGRAIVGDYENKKKEKSKMVGRQEEVMEGLEEGVEVVPEKQDEILNKKL